MKVVNSEAPELGAVVHLSIIPSGVGSRIWEAFRKYRWVQCTQDRKPSTWSHSGRLDCLRRRSRSPDFWSAVTAEILI